MKNKEGYRHVYFRLDQNIYEWGRGWTISSDAINEWTEEIKALVVLMGFKLSPPQFSSACYQGFTEDGQDIYMHPMSFSGIIHLNDLPKAHQAVREFKSKYWRLSKVDSYALHESCGDFKKIDENIESFKKLD